MAYGADPSAKLTILTTDGMSVFLLFACLCVPAVDGHGRLMDPPSRSSLWREGFNNPTNYDDNQLFCGGFDMQWNTHDGKCGLCGDPWPGPRENEPGGKYANGIISRKYQEGEIIEVYVQLTASHKGYFEFRLCQHDNPLTNISQACLDRHLLVVNSTGETRYMVPDSGTSKDLKIKLRLPSGVTCMACVLQWKYNAGNSWGVDPVTGAGCIGCGPQEQFYGCADVAIGHDEVVTGVPQKNYTSSVSHTDRPSGSEKEHHSSTDGTPTEKPPPEQAPNESDSNWRFGIASVFGTSRNASSVGSSQSAICWLVLLLFPSLQVFSW